MKKSRAFLAAVIVILTIVVWSCAAANRPVRILPLGDSITQGGSIPQEYTYRLPLQRLLVDADIKFDFIGSLNTGLQPAFVWSPVAPGIAFDPDHEGHYGWKTGAVRARLAGWLQLYEPPDIALIHLGTNDQNAAAGATNETEANQLFTQAIVQPLEEIIALLRNRNPQVAILVGHLNLDSETAQQIRRLVEAMAARLSTQDSPVVTVHHYRGFIPQPGAGSDTFDGVHPNSQGQQKMAVAWFNAMKPYLHPS